MRTRSDVQSRRPVQTAAVVSIAITLAIGVALATPRSVRAQDVEEPFNASYTATDLGSVPGVPVRYGGLTFLAGDANTLLIGGTANEAGGKLYSIAVVRDVDGHITGFSGTATEFAEAPYNDGGVVYGPGGVLFLARWPVNELGQLEPGSTTADKVIDLAPLMDSGDDSISALNFIPAGYPGAGQMKIVNWDDGEWFSAAYSADGGGTYDVTSLTYETTIQGGPEGFVFVPQGSPLFPPDSILVAEFSANNISTYQLDPNGDPILASRLEVVTDLNGAEGAAIDPVTGDLLFSTFGATNRVIKVEGFATPGQATATPVPTATPIATSAPTATPVPTATPIATSAPTATPVSTATPIASSRPTEAPTVTPAPTAAAAPNTATAPNTQVPSLIDWAAPWLLLGAAVASLAVPAIAFRHRRS